MCIDISKMTQSSCSQHKCSLSPCPSKSIIGNFVVDLLIFPFSVHFNAVWNRNKYASTSFYYAMPSYLYSIFFYDIKCISTVKRLLNRHRQDYIIEPWLIVSLFFLLFFMFLSSTLNLVWAYVNNTDTANNKNDKGGGGRMTDGISSKWASLWNDL